MGTKRSRKGGELPTRSSGVSSLSYAATERPPPTKVPRTAAATAQPSSARRFGFKGPSISQLPTPVTAATTIKTQRSLASDTHGETLVGVRSAVDVVESAAPIELDVHVLDTFKESFSQEMTTTLEQLLAFKHKTNKFAVKARKEEQINYIKQLKAGVRDVVATIQDFSKECTTMDDKLTAEKATLERRLAVLQHAARSKDQSETELKQLRQQYEIMQKSAARIRASEQEVVRSNAVLRDNAAKLEIQLEVAQKAKEQLKLDLKAHEARMVDESRRFEDIKHELELSYERKGHNEDKRKQAELEKLQEQLSKTREELASVHKDLDNYKDRAIDAANSLNDERERRTRAEMEKCTLEAKNQALETRVSSAENEVAELKGKLQHKDGEVSNLVKSLTEIQKFNATASTKVEADKKELADKVERLQTAIRTLERQESSNLTTVRDLRNQLELEIKSRKEAEKSEQEVRARMKQLESELQEKMQKVGVEGGVRQMLEDQVRELRTEHIAVNAQMEAVKAEMKRLQFAGVDSKEQHNKQIDILEERFRQERANFRSQIDNLQEEKVSLESEVQTLRTRASTVRDGDVEELCKVKREADILRRRLTELTNQGAQSIAQKDDMILELEEKVKQGDKMRRAMHNTIQELRGNVRVFARTRPFLPSDHCDPNTTTPVISCDFNGESLKLRRPGKNPSDPDTFAFTFDKVFAPSAGQDSVFERTGSGKTHTMQGSGNGQMRGIIPRAIEMILQECETLKDQGWNYITKVSFLEIYNETLKDLLATKHSGDNKLGIKKDSKGGVYVPGLTLVDVTATDQVEVLMERASRARSVACTDMNAQSSRSHSVFTLHLQGVNDKDGVMLNGQLNLVDLAGSERASRSNVSGDRLKETQAINKSLSCLADVFNAIGNKASHIPFRNSKLTYLLQSSLSGDGKTLMMVNLSPTLESASESLCSLRFAKQVNQCELGKPKRQIKSRKERP
ncbi:Kinesin-like protein [Phytophthora cactorum]|uniref:Kinesin-like protein n=1 Tax=Phytophthora cactorum TaxID=29920 RepID=A0A8T1HIY4_9STRA|nr:Kinesin-like protein [Phytophthora cactorum]KAG2920740.1 Kinesin-like protein [Phytophthora cactorum]KAG2983295.1 Kinesin-like protein [Phytophthora cactorum]KAG3064216.1 Kinesin-like protein [Phytophthora cactorum]KAG3168119.1 Kinesin-like protein [Phytophthora cactorum]